MRPALVQWGKGCFNGRIPADRAGTAIVDMKAGSATIGTITRHLGSIDPDQKLVYYSDLYITKMPWLFALCLVIGVWAIGWMPGPNPGWLGIPVGVFGLAYCVYERAVPRTMLELSPDGLGYRNISKNIIPWEAIADITVTDHSYRFRGATMIHKDVTVIWITRADYAQHIYKGTNLISRGPFWDNNFIHEGNQTGIVIPHELVQMEAARLRGEIMARWEKFSGRTAGALSARTERAKQVAMRGTRVMDVVFGVVGFLVCAAFLVWSSGWVKPPRDDSAYWKEQQARNAEIERKAQRISDEAKRTSPGENFSKSFPSWMTDEKPKQ